MKIPYYFAGLLLFIAATAASADNTSAVDKDKLSRVLQVILPGEIITAIQPTPIADLDRKSTRLNSSHSRASRMPSSA